MNAVTIITITPRLITLIKKSHEVESDRPMDTKAVYLSRYRAQIEFAKAQGWKLLDQRLLNFFPIHPKKDLPYLQKNKHPWFSTKQLLTGRKTVKDRDSFDKSLGSLEDHSEYYTDQEGTPIAIVTHPYLSREEVAQCPVPAQLCATILPCGSWYHSTATAVLFTADPIYRKQPTHQRGSHA